MMKRWLLLVVIVPTLVGSVHGGIIFGRKKDKIDPKTRVPELITVLKNDRDADHRAHAAEELRNFDAQTFPDIIPVLTVALLTDPKSSVRVEAAVSLGKIRPINQAAGEALEKALASDSAMRVRLQARSALMQYHWAGYRSGKKTDVPPLGTTREPPVAGGENLPPVIRTTPDPKQPLLFPKRTVPVTKEPPLAPRLEPVPQPTPTPIPTPPPVPAPMEVPSAVPSNPQPLPSAPTQMPAGSPAPSAAEPGPDLP